MKFKETHQHRRAPECISSDSASSSGSSSDSGNDAGQVRIPIQQPITTSAAVGIDDGHFDIHPDADYPYRGDFGPALEQVLANARRRRSRGRAPSREISAPRQPGPSSLSPIRRRLPNYFDETAEIRRAHGMELNVHPVDNGDGHHDVRHAADSRTHEFSLLLRALENVTRQLEARTARHHSEPELEANRLGAPNDPHTWYTNAARTEPLVLPNQELYYMVNGHLDTTPPERQPLQVGIQSSSRVPVQQLPIPGRLELDPLGYGRQGLSTYVENIDPHLSRQNHHRFSMNGNNDVAVQPLQPPRSPRNWLNIDGAASFPQTPQAGLYRPAVSFRAPGSMGGMDFRPPRATHSASWEGWSYRSPRPRSTLWRRVRPDPLQEITNILPLSALGPQPAAVRPTLNRSVNTSQNLLPSTPIRPPTRRTMIDRQNQLPLTYQNGTIHGPAHQIPQTDPYPVNPRFRLVEVIPNGQITPGPSGGMTTPPTRYASSWLHTGSNLPGISEMLIYMPFPRPRGYEPEIEDSQDEPGPCPQAGQLPRL